MLGHQVVIPSKRDRFSGGTSQCTPSSVEGVSIQRHLDLLGLVRGVLVWGTSAGRGLRRCNRRKMRIVQERLVSRTRRLDSSQLCRTPLLLGVSVRETDWPPLWPVSNAVGEFGTRQPGVLYP